MLTYVLGSDGSLRMYENMNPEAIESHLRAANLFDRFLTQEEYAQLLADREPK